MPLARILISDDDPATAELYRFTFIRHGFEVLVAPGGRGFATLELCRAELPDLVITDINKPDLRGPELCRAIRADPRTAHIPVLFVSAMGQQRDIYQSRIAGADDYIIKPFFIEALLYRIIALLSLARNADSRLVTLNMHLPTVATYHPVTGLPGPQALAEALPQLATGSDWVLHTFNILHFEPLLRAYNMALGDSLLLRLSSHLLIALEQSGASGHLVAHPAYDWRMSVVGKAAALNSIAAELSSRLAADLCRRLRPEDLAQGHLRYTDSHGRRHESPLPALTIQSLGPNQGPLTSLRALWNALDSAPVLTLTPALE